ncbi:zinc finger protein CONSTANS-LIKE 10-like [Camellia sinensis]|uniref:zinc finger protein CONSTANS-LIKE 10-like n=1 Tax=Camellia sinensis TaxID=4442 RepID=UPI001035AB07|nr:zinc finger protein CONSTANS-LIKE 10-like [Camellia sinensis]
MDDLDLNLENYEELSGSDNLFENGDVHGDDINTRCAFPFEVSSATHIQTMLPTCSDSISDDPATNCNTDPTLCSQGQAYSSIPLLFASLTGESGVEDY